MPCCSAVTAGRAHAVHSVVLPADILASFLHHEISCRQWPSTQLLQLLVQFMTCFYARRFSSHGAENFQAAVSQRSCVNILQLEICGSTSLSYSMATCEEIFQVTRHRTQGTGTRHGVVRWIGGSVDRDSSFGLSCFVVVVFVVAVGVRVSDGG